MRARPESITATTPSIVIDDLRDVGRQDDLAPVAGAHGARLLLQRHLAVQRQHGQGGGAGQLGDRRLRAADVAGAGEKHQHVAVGLVAQHAADRSRDLGGQRPIVVGRGVFDRDVEHPPLAAHDIGAEEVADRIGVDGRRHRDHRQVAPFTLAQPPQPGQRDIGGDVALVQLVEHDRRHAAQPRVGEHAAHEQPLGDEAQARLRAAGLVEADSVADSVADALAQLGGDARRGQPCRQPPRLEHPDLAAVGGQHVQQHARDARRLAGAGGRLDDRGAARADRGCDRWQARVDGQLGHRRRPVLSRPVTPGSTSGAWRSSWRGWRPGGIPRMCEDRSSATAANE